MSVLFASTLVIQTVQAATADENICAAPLRAALMTVKASGTATNSSEASIAWQCSFKFSNHDEALNAGLTVGTVVYGVPLKVGGSFDNRVVHQWKEENCSKNSQNASFEGASFSYLRQVAPGAMDAFVACVQANVSTSALACSLSRNPAALAVKWRRTNGEAQSAAPKIHRFMVTNGSCQPGLVTGTVVGDGGVGTPCTPEDKKDLMAMVETSRGLCMTVAHYPKKVFSVVGTMTLDGDRQIASDVVEFQSGSRIITNGHSLTLAATELRIVGGAKIDAFEKNAPSPKPGTPGASGGAVLVKIADLTGDGDFRIDLTGQDGTAGAPGANGSPGPAGTDARGRGLQSIFSGCGGGNDSSPGGPGTPGKDPGQSASNDERPLAILSISRTTGHKAQYGLPL
jgi:hypothetical protein